MRTIITHFIFSYVSPCAQSIQNVKTHYVQFLSYPSAQCTIHNNIFFNTMTHVYINNWPWYVNVTKAIQPQLVLYKQYQYNIYGMPFTEHAFNLLLLSIRLPIQSVHTPHAQFAKRVRTTNVCKCSLAYN